VRDSGNWQELLEETQAAQSLTLVVSRHADERLWSEVLNLGGFDVLALPFDREELRRALSSALRQSPRPSVAAAAGGGPASA
jgi:DNA-binding response OmpR family regulator